MLKYIILMLLLSFSLAACGGESAKFDSGQIIDRNYSEAHTDLVPQLQYAGQTCNTINNVQSCSPRFVPVLIPVYVPAAWKIKIQNCNVTRKDGSMWVNKDGSNKCFTKWIHVDETTYNNPNTSEGETWG